MPVSTVETRKIEPPVPYRLGRDVAQKQHLRLHVAGRFSIKIESRGMRGRHHREKNSALDLVITFAILKKNVFPVYLFKLFVKMGVIHGCTNRY